MMDVSMTDDWETHSTRNATVIPNQPLVGTLPTQGSTTFATVTQIESLEARMKLALEHLEDK